MPDAVCSRVYPGCLYVLSAIADEETGRRLDTMAAATHALHFANALRAESTLPLPSGNRMPLLGLGTYELRLTPSNRYRRRWQPAIDDRHTGDYHTQRGIGDALGTAASSATPSSS